MPGWTLLGEYCGVYDKVDEVERRVNADPLGLGTMRRDRVTELEYTCKETRAGISSGESIRDPHPVYYACGHGLATGRGEDLVAALHLD